MLMTFMIDVMKDLKVMGMAVFALLECPISLLAGGIGKHLPFRSGSAV